MTTTDTPSLLMTVHEVADLYDVDEATIRKWARARTIPSFKVGSARNAPYRFRRASLEADMTRREKAMAAGKAA